MLEKRPVGAADRHAGADQLSLSRFVALSLASRRRNDAQVIGAAERNGLRVHRVIMVPRGAGPNAA